MLQLIRKDVVLQRYTFLILLPLLIVYLILDVSSNLLGFLFSMAITMQAFAVDEKRHIHLLVNSLPYTRKEIVTAKYIGACFFMSLMLLTLFVGNFIINGEILSWKEILFMVCLVLLVTSLLIPFSYIFRSQYLMIAVLVVFAAYLVTINLFINDLNDRIREIVTTLLTMQQLQLYVLVSCAMLIIYFLSWLVSVRIYEKKVF